MSLLKEIYDFGKMLFTPISDEPVVKMYASDYFPFDGYAYLMWCGHVVYKKSRPDLANMDLQSLNHESIHIEQARDCGSWLSYYISYVWNWFKHNPFSKRSYYINKYEIEAYAKEDDLEYCTRREPMYVELFNFPEAKQEYSRLVWPYRFVQEIKKRFASI